MTKITIVRHGETEWNKSMQLQGFTDSPLTPKGIRQAELLAEEIKMRKFACLITSDLYRAVHTARLINKYLNLEIIENKGLRERSFGIMEGLTLETIQQKYAVTYQAYMQRKASFDIPEGESLTRFYNRVIKTFDEIIEKYTDKQVLIVAHGGVLDCIIRKVFHLDLDEKRNFTIYNTSVNSFIVRDKEWLLDEWGNINHIKDLQALNEKY